MSQYGTEPAGTTPLGSEPVYGTEGSTGDGGTAEQVKGQVREKAQVAQDKARGVVGQARGRVSEQVDLRSTEAGERVAGTASDVRSIAEELRTQGKDTPARLAEQVADQADRVGEYLKGASGDRILRDVEGFARRQPMLVAAAGLALGFAASRFLKASSSRRYESDGDYGTGRAYATGTYRSTSPYSTVPAYDDTATYETGAAYERGTGYETGVPVAGTYDDERRS